MAMTPKPVDHVRHHRGRAPLEGDGSGYTGIGGRATSPVDHARSHRARAALAGERDKLLKQGTERINMNKFAQNTGKDRARAILVALALCLSTMLGFVLMMLQWFLVFHNSLAHTMVVLVVLLFSSAFLAVISSRRALGKDRPWLRYAGALLLASTLVGLVTGFTLYYKYIVYYWKYTEMRTYTNIAAAQSSTAFKDGSMFLFTEDSKVDNSQAVGYQSRWTGETYCVAPVIDSTMGGNDNIYYWAIGEGCCQPRASFYCNDAMDQATRSALMVLQPEDIVRPYMRWAVQDSEYSRYMDAIKLAEGNYYIKAAPKPALLYWTKDPVGFMSSFYSTAKGIATRVGVLYACLQLVACYFIAWTLLQKPKNQSVLRQPA